MKTSKTLQILSAVILAASPIAAFAQDATPQRGGNRGNFNPEEFRQRMNERLKASLKVTDEEWNVIQPLIEKVQTKQRDAMSGRFGGRGPGGPGGDRGGDRGGNTQGNRSDRPGAAESEALRTALENDSSTPEDLKAKLNAVREQRKKSAAELAAAREELRKVLTVRQEAALVSAGILE
jgi:Spy/CpxP family protein refolding chaperone